MTFKFTRNNTFCISLDSRPDRWVKMESMFQYFGMDVSRWSASTVSTDTFSDYLSPAQRGCSQSHINIWRYIINNKLDFGFIMEDDARFVFDWKEKLTGFIEQTAEKNDYDIILLNASEPITPSHNWVLQEEQYLTGGYIISFKGAKWLLDNYQGCFYSSDWMTSRLLKNGKGYSYFPWLIIQEGYDSTIGEQYEQDHAKVIRCLGSINYSIENNYWKPENI